MSWSRLSTEQGPAMIVSEPSPIAASSTRMTVSSGWNSRDVSLNGREIGVTRSTPAIAASWLISCSRRPASSPDDCQDGRGRARVLVRREALREDAALHAEDLGFRCAVAHHHEHRARVPPMGNKKAEVSPLPCPTRPAPGHGPGSSHAGLRYQNEAFMYVAGTVVHARSGVNRDETWSRPRMDAPSPSAP